MDDVAAYASSHLDYFASEPRRQSRPRIVDLCQRDLVSGVDQLACRAEGIRQEVVCADRRSLSKIAKSIGVSIGVICQYIRQIRVDVVERVIEIC